MSKRVLILVLSADFEPYQKMIETSMATWDSISVEGTDTVFYCGQSDKRNTDKIIYLPVEESLFTMGQKLLMAFEWALKNKEFEFLARPHSCVYVDKKNLINHIQELPEKNLFEGPVTVSQNNIDFIWGGTGWLFSKDVVQKIVDNKQLWNDTFMEDESLGLIATALKIPLTNGYTGAIDNMGDHWRCITYGEGESITFTDFKDLIPLKHHFYRIKVDGKRHEEEAISQTMFKTFNQ